MGAFLVDGDLEQRFLQDICPGKKVLKIGCNGREVHCAAIAKRIKALIATMRNHFPIVVCLDLEGRRMTASQFESEIKIELEKNGVELQSIVISVVDRMIENWILSDTEATGLSRGAGDADGFNGKAKIKNQLSTYHETTIGVALLKKVRHSVAVNNSPSFKRFSEQVTPHLGDCWWMRR